MWKVSGKWFFIAMIYVVFFSVVGFALYLTKNANCLWALLLMPSYNSKSDDTDDKDE